MSKSKLFSAAVATGLAVSGADAAQQPAAGDDSRHQVADLGPIAPDDRPAPTDIVGTEIGTDPLILGAAEDEELELFFAPPAGIAESGGLIELHIFDEDADRDLTGADDGDFYLAQTIYGGGGVDRLGPAGQNGGRLTPGIEPSPGGAKLTTPNAAKRVTPGRTIKKQGRTGSSLKTRKKK